MVEATLYPWIATAIAGVILVMSILHVFILAAVNQFRKEKRQKILVVQDAAESFNAPYYVTLVTGSRPGSGTSAVVKLTLSGQSGTRAEFVLNPTVLDLGKHYFRRGGEDSFLLMTQNCLGELLTLELELVSCHNNNNKDNKKKDTGNTPSDVTSGKPTWFLSHVLVKCALTDHVTYFPCHDWIRREPDRLAAKVVLIGGATGYKLFHDMYARLFVREHAWIKALFCYSHSLLNNTLDILFRTAVSLALLMSSVIIAGHLTSSLSSTLPASASPLGPTTDMHTYLRVSVLSLLPAFLFAFKLCFLERALFYYKHRSRFEHWLLHAPLDTLPMLRHDDVSKGMSHVMDQLSSSLWEPYCHDHDYPAGFNQSITLTDETDWSPEIPPSENRSISDWRTTSTPNSIDGPRMKALANDSDYAIYANDPTRPTSIENLENSTKEKIGILKNAESEGKEIARWGCSQDVQESIGLDEVSLLHRCVHKSLDLIHTAESEPKTVEDDEFKSLISPVSVTPLKRDPPSYENNSFGTMEQQVPTVGKEVEIGFRYQQETISEGLDKEPIESTYQQTENSKAQSDDDFIETWVFVEKPLEFVLTDLLTPQLQEILQENESNPLPLPEAFEEEQQQQMTSFCCDDVTAMMTSQQEETPSEGTPASRDALLREGLCITTQYLRLCLTPMLDEMLWIVRDTYTGRGSLNPEHVKRLDKFKGQLSNVLRTLQDARYDVNARVEISKFQADTIGPQQACTQQGNNSDLIEFSGSNNSSQSKHSSQSSQKIRAQTSSDMGRVMGGCHSDSSVLNTVAKQPSSTAYLSYPSSQSYSSVLRGGSRGEKRQTRSSSSSSLFNRPLPSNTEIQEAMDMGPVAARLSSLLIEHQLAGVGSQNIEKQFSAHARQMRAEALQSMRQSLAECEQPCGGNTYCSGNSGSSTVNNGSSAPEVTYSFPSSRNTSSESALNGAASVGENSSQDKDAKFSRIPPALTQSEALTNEGSGSALLPQISPIHNTQSETAHSTHKESFKSLEGSRKSSVTNSGTVREWQDLIWKLPPTGSRDVITTLSHDSHRAEGGQHKGLSAQDESPATHPLEVVSRLAPRFTDRIRKDTLLQIASASLQSVLSSETRVRFSSIIAQRCESEARGFAEDVVNSLYEIVRDRLQKLVAREQQARGREKSEARGADSTEEYGATGCGNENSTISCTDDFNELFEHAHEDIQRNVLPVISEHLLRMLTAQANRLETLDVELLMLLYGGQFVDTIVTNAVLQTHVGLVRRASKVNSVAGNGSGGSVGRVGASQSKDSEVTGRSNNATNQNVSNNIRLLSGMNAKNQNVSNKGRLRNSVHSVNQNESNNAHAFSVNKQTVGKPLQLTHDAKVEWARETNKQVQFRSPLCVSRSNWSRVFKIKETINNHTNNHALYNHTEQRYRSISRVDSLNASHNNNTTWRSIEEKFAAMKHDMAGIRRRKRIVDCGKIIQRTTASDHHNYSTPDYESDRDQITFTQATVRDRPSSDCFTSNCHGGYNHASPDNHINTKNYNNAYNHTSPEELNFDSFNDNTNNSNNFATSFECSNKTSPESPHPFRSSILRPGDALVTLPDQYDVADVTSRVLEAVHERLRQADSEQLSGLMGGGKIHCGLCRPKAIREIKRQVAAMAVGRHLTLQVYQAALDEIHKLSLCGGGGGSHDDDVTLTSLFNSDVTGTPRAPSAVTLLDSSLLQRIGRVLLEDGGEEGEGEEGNEEGKEGERSACPLSPNLAKLKCQETIERVAEEILNEVMSRALARTADDLIGLLKLSHDPIGQWQRSKQESRQQEETVRRQLEEKNCAELVKPRNTPRLTTPLNDKDIGELSKEYEQIRRMLFAKSEEAQPVKNVHFEDDLVRLSSMEAAPQCTYFRHYFVAKAKYSLAARGQEGKRGGGTGSCVGFVVLLFLLIFALVSMLAATAIFGSHLTSAPAVYACVVGFAVGLLVHCLVLEPLKILFLTMSRVLFYKQVP